MSRRPKSGEFVVEPGRVYTISDPVTGSFPVRTEITGMSADDLKTPVGFTVSYEKGGAITRVDDRGKELEHPVMSKDGLKPGNLLIAPTLVGEVQAVVAVDNVGDLCWVSGDLVGDLEYDKERGCWITTLAINKKLLT